MKMCFVWHPWQIFCKYPHTILLTNVVMNMLSAWVFGVFVLLHPSLLWVCLYQTSLCCTHPYPDIHLFKCSWTGLYIIGVSGMEKLDGNLNKTDAETSLSAVKFMSCFSPEFDSYRWHAVELAGREQKSFHFQEALWEKMNRKTQWKQSPFKTRLKQRNANIEKFPQKTNIVTCELDSQKVLLSRDFFARGPGSQVDISSIAIVAKTD